MATGGGRNVKRTFCSVCLEHVRGRVPKLLPCFHTVCLPCLTRLADTEQSDNEAGGEDLGENTSITITCPTCRSVIPVPSGGVEQFQTNFYIEEEESEPQPQPCDLCDGLQSAQHHCDKCQHSFCSLCQRGHDKLCQGGRVTDLQGSGSRGPAQDPALTQTQQQLTRVQEGLKTLREEKRRLSQERQSQEQHIHTRYASLLRHASDARDACLVSLREACQDVSDTLDSHLTRALHAQDILQHQLSSSTPTAVSRSQLQTALFLQEDFAAILSSLGGEASWLRYETTDNTDQLVDCVEVFMGKVTKTSQASDPDHSGASACGEGLTDTGTPVGTMETPVGTSPDKPERETPVTQDATDEKTDASAPLSASVQDAQDRQPSCGTASLPSQDRQPSCATASVPTLPPQQLQDVQTLYSKMEELRAQLTCLQSANTQLTQHVSQLSSTTSQLSLDQSRVHKDLSSVKDETKSLTADSRTLHQQVRSVSDKQGILLQDLALLTADKDAVKAQVSRLDTHLTQLPLSSLQADLASLKLELVQAKTDTLQVKTDTLQVKTDVDQVKTDVDQVKTDVDQVKKNVDKQKTDTDQTKTDIGQLKTDHSALKTDHAALKMDHTALKTDHTAVKTQVSSIHNNMADLKKDHSSLRSDLSSSKGEVTSLQRKLQSTQDSLQNKMKTFVSDSRFLAANTQVAFHAILSGKPVTTNKEQTLICNEIITKAGGGYNECTGVFTVPVAGLYCFMATSSPCKAEKDIKARLVIVVDGVVNGHLYSSGTDLSTGHTVVKVTAGQKVWLRTFSDRQYTFNGGWWTSFSGWLLQRDV